MTTTAEQTQQKTFFKGQDVIKTQSHIGFSTLASCALVFSDILNRFKTHHTTVVLCQKTYIYENTDALLKNIKIYIE